ncbi:MAG TPA: hypothetical protein VGZ29_15745, partial [Terriglobia bacterium]|nr:hypothetical protein [Terriglobia bacterium]
MSLFLAGLIVSAQSQTARAAGAAGPAAPSHTTWSDYAGGEDSAQYSALRQINRSNVTRLQV